MDRAGRQRRTWRAAATIGAAALVAVLVAAGCGAPGSTSGPAASSNGARSSSPAGSAPAPTVPSSASTSAPVSAPVSTSTPPPASGPTAPLAGRVAGRSFVSTSVTGHRLAAGSEIDVRFGRGGDVSWQAGCNSMSGSAHWHGSTLSVDRVISTEMGCAKPLMDQDEWFAASLKAGVGVDLHGDTLTLTGDGATIRFVDSRIASPDRPLQGTTWRLDGIVDGDAVSSVPGGIAATLHIASGRIHFFDGLNDHDGPDGTGAALVVGPHTVTIHGQIGTSAVGCAAGRSCSVDMSLLGTTFTYQIVGARLTVGGTGPYVNTGLIFVAGSASSGDSTVAGTEPSGGGPIAPKRPPIVSPGSMTPLPTSADVRPTLSGRHDSIPPQPPTH